MPLRRIRFKRLWRLTVDAACFLHASGYAPRITANRLLVCLLSIHVTAGVAAAPPNVDTFVRDYMTRRQIPGVAVLVRRGGETVRAKGYGLANVEHRIPMKPETVFQSGSMGKQFTAMAVAMLAEDGKLGLDDPVEKHLEVPASWRGITIRHLLTHTSGLGTIPRTSHCSAITRRVIY